MNTITVYEAQKEKLDTEKKIQDILDQFSRKTELLVEGVELYCEETTDIDNGYYRASLIVHLHEPL